MDYSLDSWDFGAKYKEDYREATGKEIRDAYGEYKDFYAKYHQNNRGATTDCYEEYLKTKQGKRRAFIGRIEEQREKSLNTVTGFVLYCKRGSWALLVGAEQSRSKS